MTSAVTQAMRSPTASGERLQKVLARAGMGSRRVCEGFIADGRAAVNDEIVQLGARVVPTDRITVDGVPVITDTSLVYCLLHKPVGIVTTAHDPQGRRTVMEFVASEPRLFPVGRLDLNTSGLLIMTNDGELANLLTHPRHGVHKTYVAEVEGDPTPATVRRLRAGVELLDGITAPAECRVIGRRPGSAIVELVLHEGRNRQVRRMCEAVGHPVLQLSRSRIGNLRDANLHSGQSRPLSAAEVRDLYAVALGEPSSARANR